MGMALVMAATTLSVIVSGCGPATCNCPDPIYGMVVVPADTSRPLGVVLVDELECIASDIGAVAGGRMVTVSRSAPGSCHVRAELWNGAGAYTFTVEFQSPGGCCGFLSNAVSMSVPQAVPDAGSF
jgi:hypothetical protein